MFRITPEARKTKRKQDKHILFFAVSKIALLCDTDTLKTIANHICKSDELRYPSRSCRSFKWFNCYDAHFKHNKINYQQKGFVALREN